MKKHFARLCTAIIVCSSVMSVYAGKLSYENEAGMLYDMGLYNSISEYGYDLGLDDTLTREEVAMVLVIFFEQQNEVAKMDNNKVKATLAQFVDADKISEKARKSVAYLVNKGCIQGSIIDGRRYFNPSEKLKGLDYACLLLRQMGIKDFEYTSALERLEREGVITAGQKNDFDKSQLKRDDVIGMSYNVLKERNKNKKNKQVNTPSQKLTPNPVVTPSTKPTVIEAPKGQVKNVVKTQKDGQIYLPTVAPTVTPSSKPVDTNTTLKRANNAVRLGYWKLTNERREDVNVNRIWFTAEYTGQVSVLRAEDITDFSVEDVYGNVYAVFSDINGNPNDDIKTYVIAKKRVDLEKTFVIPAASGMNAAEKELVLYGRIKEGAAPGGMIEVFLGDGSNIYEAKGTKSDADIRIKGPMLKQEEEDGKKMIALSRVVPKMGTYSKDPIARAYVPVARVELVNEGYRAIKMKQLRFRELTNSTGKTTYTLRNEEAEVVAVATRNDDKEIIFTLSNGGEKIAGLGSELFTIQLNDKPEKGTSIQLKLLAEDTYYDSSDDKGYKMDIDAGLLLEETVFKK